MKAPVAAVELGEVRRGGVERPVRPDGDVLLQPDAAGGEAGQQRAVFGADGRGCVLDPQVRSGALQQGRLQEAGGGEAVNGQVRCWLHLGGVFQVCDPLAQRVGPFRPACRNPAMRR